MRTSPSPEGRFAKLVEEFFLERLIRQRNLSPQTVAAYRDCFRLLFEVARDHRNKPRTGWCWPIWMLSLVLAFPDHLEKDRKNSIRESECAPRRSAVIHAFCRAQGAGFARSDTPPCARHSDQAL